MQVRKRIFVALLCEYIRHLDAGYQACNFNPAAFECLRCAKHQKLYEYFNADRIKNREGRIGDFLEDVVCAVNTKKGKLSLFEKVYYVVEGLKLPKSLNS